MRITPCSEAVDYDPYQRDVVMSGWGASSHWYRIVEATGDVEDHSLPPSEAANVLADSERRNRWIRPIVQRSQGLGSNRTGPSRADSPCAQNSLWVRFGNHRRRKPCQLRLQTGVGGHPDV